MTTDAEQPAEPSRVRRLFDASAMSDREVLERIRDGWTFAQFEDAAAARAGVTWDGLGTVERVCLRSRVEWSIIQGMSRGGLGSRYHACTPWRVRDEHSDAYELAVLRILGRRRCGEPLSPRATSQLQSFLTLLGRAGVVVGYCPELEAGFTYLPEGWRSGPDPDVPICAGAVSLAEVTWLEDHRLRDARSTIRETEESQERSPRWP